MDLPTGRITIPKEVVRRAFGEDKVLLNLSTGHYHGLNPTGFFMVALLEETGEALLTAQRTSVELKTPLHRVTEDLAALCADLEQRGLIEIDGS
ncbi:MAG: PqqD family protein [Solirubrobacteraceae bacterium]